MRAETEVTVDLKVFQYNNDLKQTVKTTLDWRQEKGLSLS